MRTPRITPARRDALTARVSAWLFAQDPMHTCCVENEAVDEYDAVARYLVDRLAEGDAPAVALHAALAVWFGDEMTDEARLTPLVSSLSELLDAKPVERGDNP
ncbi:hypothetical protein [Halomonas sp.]|uniref:hypothetical protein n=1 Tax=Halomonas sp. TaxID=1486246 RepID=UPI003D09BF75